MNRKAPPGECSSTVLDITTDYDAGVFTAKVQMSIRGALRFEKKGEEGERHKDKER